MLEQILRDMWVAPELLEGLDESQKQSLFCKMREEQIRRWRIWDQKLCREEEAVDSMKPSLKSKNISKKNVQFLLRDDGEPLVWIMGEHEKNTEEILDEETLQKARSQAIKETEELRKSVELELGGLIEFNDGSMDSLEKDCILLKNLEKIEDIYCSVNELREKVKNVSLNFDKSDSYETPSNDSIKNDDAKNKYESNTNYKNNITNFNIIEGRREILQEINTNKNKVSARVALWEKKVMEQRTGEILRGWRDRQSQTEENDRAQQLLWEEQERKAKEAESKIRDIARKAREEHRRISLLGDDKNKSSISLLQLESESNADSSTVDKTNLIRDDITKWFVSTETSREAGLDENKEYAKWFHGLITRNEAEKLLQSRIEGSYLVRISERVRGYALSYKAAESCKHFLIDASQNTHYQFLGYDQVTHKTLANLISYHTKNNITVSGKEILITPCEWTIIPKIMEDIS